MVIHTDTQPAWYPLSHHDRYRKLTIVRRRWRWHPSCGNEDRQGLTVHLDGTWINDVPSFYLSLGEAINGPNGYFGAGLDALSDCLNGSFGVSSPLTIRLRHFDEVRNALDNRSWFRFHAEIFQQAIAAGECTEYLVDLGYLGDGSPTDIAKWTTRYAAAFAGEPFECDEGGSYFDAILAVLKEKGTELLPDKEEAR